MKKISLLLIAIAALSFGGAQAEESGAKPKTGNVHITHETVDGWLDLFRAAKKIAHSGSKVAPVNDAEAYVLDCCNSIEAAVGLLEKSGFELRYIEDEEAVALANRSYVVSHGETFDKIIGGTRSAGWWPFWDAFTEYRVGLLIREGKLERVSAHVAVPGL